MKWNLLFILASLAGCCLAGCGATAPAVEVHKTSGTITFENHPIPGAFLVLHPKGELPPDVPKPRAEVQPDGSFVATTFEPDDGAPAGEYVVTVELQKVYQVGGEHIRSSNLLPLRYSSAQTSDLVVQVNEGQ